MFKNNFIFEDDICWCAASMIEGRSGCEHIDCFRHLSNRNPSKNSPDIFTSANLRHTSYCPYYEEEK